MAANPFRPLADAWDRLVGSDAEASGLVAWLAGFRARRLFRDANLGQDVQVFGKPVLHLAEGATLQIGSGVQISARAARTRIEVGPGATLQIGAGAVLDDAALVQAYGRVAIGDNARIGFGVAILDDEGVPGREPQPVLIGAEARIGARATILRGVRIGRGAIVTAGSMVTENVPAGATASGVPAQIVEHAPVAEPTALPSPEPERVPELQPVEQTPVAEPVALAPPGPKAFTETQSAEPERAPARPPRSERIEPAPTPAADPVDPDPTPEPVAHSEGAGEAPAEETVAIVPPPPDTEEVEEDEDDVPVWPPHARRRT